MLKLHFHREDGELISGDMYDPQVWRFPCGEVGVKMSVSATTLLPVTAATIRCAFEGNDDLFAIAQLVDALRQYGYDDIALDMPYFPYARQDRRCNPGEGHALKVAAKFINDLDFSSVLVEDAHSTVLEALVDRLYVVPQDICALHLPIFDYLIAPDAGAEKKIFKHWQVVHKGVPVLCASKKRDSMGKITGVHLPYVPNYGTFGKNVCVVDDLCDGGATFIELGKHLRQMHSIGKLSLYVTHGMFTKGLDELLALYDTIYVHNLPNQAYASRVTVI